MALFKFGPTPMYPPSSLFFTLISVPQLKFNPEMRQMDYLVFTLFLAVCLSEDYVVQVNTTLLIQAT